MGDSDHDEGPAAAAAIAAPPTPLDEDDTAAPPPWTPPPGVGTPGQVARITLRDFMCHAALDVAFGPRVNFVSGANGSGKSALLQALQLALGVRAAATGRAGAAAGLVRSGAREARVEVTLWNAGPDAHRADTFGASLTIERRITASGGGSWRLRAASGATVSDKRADVDAVLDALSVDAANPVAVMTQDVARSFLGAGGGDKKAAEKKFEVYMRATLLARSEAAHAGAAAAVEEAGRHVEAEAGRVADRRADARDLAAAVERARALEEHRGDVERCERGVVWSLARGRSAALAAVDHRLAIAGPARLAAAAEDAAAADGDVEAADAAVERHGAAGAAAAAALAAAAADRDAALAAARTADKDARKAAREADEADAAAAKARGELDAAAAAARGAAADGGAAHVAAQAEADADVAATGEAAALAMTALRDADDAVGTAARRARDADDNARAADRAADDARLDAARTQAAASSADRVLQFTGRPEVARFAAGLARRDAGSARLRAPAAGPLGALVRVAQTAWLPALAACMDNLGGAYLASSQADADAVVAAATAAGAPRTRCYAVDPDRPPIVPAPLAGGRTSLLSQLALAPGAPPSLANLLIDVASADRVALAPSDAAARAAVADRGVHSALTPDGARYQRRGETVTAFPPPLPARVKPFQAAAGATPADVKRVAADASRASAAAKKARSAAVAAKNGVAAARTAFDAARSAVRAANKARDDAKARAAAVRAAGLDAVGATQGGGAGLDALVEADEGAAARAAAARDAADAATAAASEARATADAKTDAVAALKDGAASGLADLEALAAAASTARSRARSAADAVARVRAQMDAYAASRPDLAQQAADTEAAALAVCSAADGHAALSALRSSGALPPRPDPRPGANAAADAAKAAEADAERLARRAARARAALAAGEAAAGGGLADLSAALAAATAARDAAVARLRAHAAVLRALQDGLARRVEEFRRMDRQVEEAVNRRFVRYMHRKGHVGQIRVDRVARTLDIRVVVAGGAPGADGGRAPKVGPEGWWGCLAPRAGTAVAHARPKRHPHLLFRSGTCASCPAASARLPPSASPSPSANSRRPPFAPWTSLTSTWTRSTGACPWRPCSKTRPTRPTSSFCC